MSRQNDPQKKRAARTKAAKAAKKATARANGAKSKGPKTRQGRDNISKANTRHGMKARLNPLLIPNEDETKLNEITLAYYEHIRPANAAEASLVDLLIFSIWRGARLVSYEAELLTNKAEDLQPNLAETYESISSTRLFALAFEAINGKGSANPTINRYLATTRNAYHSALSDIERLRKIKGDPEQPYYQPSLAKTLPEIELKFPEPEPEPEPAPAAEPEPQPSPESNPEENTADGSQPPLTDPTSQSEPEPSSPSEPQKSESKKDEKPSKQALIARAVPNPDAPPDPFTVWVHIIGSNGRPIVDNYDRPVLKPVYIGPEKPETPTVAPIQRESVASPQSVTPEPEQKKGVVTIYNPFGLEIPDDLRTGN